LELRASLPRPHRSGCLGAPDRRGRDVISGIGQTKAALDITTRLAKAKKEYFLAPDVGHYGIFNGRKWREKIAPVVEKFIAANR
jgi:poly(3-hydroxybutyrate) depolymerase